MSTHCSLWPNHIPCPVVAVAATRAVEGGQDERAPQDGPRRDFQPFSAATDILARVDSRRDSGSRQVETLRSEHHSPPLWACVLTVIFSESVCMSLASRLIVYCATIKYAAARRTSQTSKHSTRRLFKTTFPCLFGSSISRCVQRRTCELGVASGHRTGVLTQNFPAVRCSGWQRRGKAPGTLRSCSRSGCSALHAGETGTRTLPPEVQWRRARSKHCLIRGTSHHRVRSCGMHTARSRLSRLMSLMRPPRRLCGRRL